MSSETPYFTVEGRFYVRPLLRGCCFDRIEYVKTNIEDLTEAKTAYAGLADIEDLLSIALNAHTKSNYASDNLLPRIRLTVEILDDEV